MIINFYPFLATDQALATIEFETKSDGIISASLKKCSCL